MTVIGFGNEFSQDQLPDRLPAGYADPDLLLTDGQFLARAVWAPARVHILLGFEISFGCGRAGPGQQKNRPALNS
jgi:hypothetical protein